MASRSRHPAPKIVRPDDVDPAHRWTDRCRRRAARRSISRSASISAGCRVSPRARARRARQLRSRRAALVRPAQYSLHHQHGDRRVGARQAHALFAAHGKRRAVHLGFRQCGAPHKLYAPWLHADHCRAGLLGLRGATGGRSDAVPRRGERDQVDPRCRRRRRHAGGRRRGEPPMLFALQKAGIEVRDGQQVMLEARESRTSTS